MATYAYIIALPGSMGSDNFMYSPNSLEKVTNTPMISQVGKPIKIFNRYFFSRTRFVNNMKKSPLFISLFFDLVKRFDSKTETLNNKSKMPIPPPIK